MKALKNMSCPFIIQPHQIQGLDYPRLFPVIQWLVKIVLNFQQETAEFTRRQAAIQFGKIAKVPDPVKIRDLKGLFLPKRKFKTSSSRKLNDPIRVYAALLEFGDATAGSSYQQYVNMNKENSKNEMQGKEGKDVVSNILGKGTKVEKTEGRGEVGAGKIAERTAEVSSEKILERLSEKPRDRAPGDKQTGERVGEEKKANPDEEEEEVDLLEQETERIELRKSVTVIGRNVAKIVKSENISMARSQYLDIKKEENPEIMQKRLEKEREERLILTLSKEMSINTENLEKIQAQSAEIKAEVARANSILDEEKDMNNRLKESIANLVENTQESRAALNANLAMQLEQLVIKRNQLKEAQKIFKDKCNKEIEELNKLSAPDIDIELQEWFDKIEKSYSETLKRYEKARTILAEKNQEVAILQRKLESKPSQTELTQYQRRFVELYEQINLKVEENRRFYASYNSLIEVRNLLESEISTLDSFQQGFKQSKKKSEKESFAESVTGGIMQVADKTKKAQEKQRVLQETLKELEKKYKHLEEVERSYYQMVKEFNDIIGIS